MDKSFIHYVDKSTKKLVLGSKKASGFSKLLFSKLHYHYISSYSLKDYNL